MTSILENMKMTMILKYMKVTLNLKEDGDIELDDGAGECAWMLI